MEAWRLYLFVIAKNVALRKLISIDNEGRNKKRYAAGLKRVVAFNDRVWENECEKVLLCGIESLTIQQREIFVLKYYRFKVGVIAKGLNISPITVSRGS